METEAWEALRTLSNLPEIQARRPSKGTHVRVISGRRLGMQGEVTWHGVGHFDQSKWRYGDSMQKHMQTLIGGYGYTVRVVTPSGECFYIAAEKVCVL